MSDTVKTPHKHAELIKAWADGAVIEWRSGANRTRWGVIDNPNWNGLGEFRVQPEPTVWYCGWDSGMCSNTYRFDPRDRVKLADNFLAGLIRVETVCGVITKVELV